MTRSPIYKEIGAIIQARRKKLDRTQKRLAAELGISRGALANIETGRQNMLVHQLYNFAKALHMSPTDLLPSLVENNFDVERTALPLPSNLKGLQKAQVAQFYMQTTPEENDGKEISHVKPSKR
jgi:transcriptional regulator with XRE-family HTH domain